MQISLTQCDRQFLFKKYLKEGLTKDEADFRIKKTCLHLNNLIEKLKIKEVSQQDIQRIFIEELANY